MADAITDTEQVKTIVQGVLAWMPVISPLAAGVLTGSVDLLVSRVNHRYVREREETAAAERLRHEQQLAEDKRQKELLHDAVLLHAWCQIFKMSHIRITHAGVYVE
ncbi:Uncharacterised protein [Yersinia frederiksenii]|nr:Uncharacterised protein [Yersinia frederiksenii]CNJ06928.1 Uncharacterised protein [Yersinia frederiksenii]